jgi:ABC-type glycerol-3-phosphate transport system substrate-binding protein
MTIHSWMLAFGGGVLESGGYQFNTDRNLAALEFLQTLRKDDGCAWMTIDPDNPSALHAGPFYEQFARRSALFITGDLTEAAALSTVLGAVGDEWTMIPFPGTEDRVVTVYGPSYTLLKTTPERQLAAWLFVRAVIQPGNQAEWVQTTGTFPLSTTAAEALATYGNTHPQWADAVQALEYARGVPQLASWRTVRYILEDGSLQIFLENVHIQIIPAILDEMDATAQEFSGEE